MRSGRADGLVLSRADRATGRRWSLVGARRLAPSGTSASLAAKRHVHSLAVPQPLLRQASEVIR